MSSKIAKAPESVPLESLDFSALEQKLNVKMALDESTEDGISGLPPYRFADSREIPAGLSPLLRDESIERYLKQARGEASQAAEALKATLLWRQLVFPREAPGGRPLEMLQEGRRFRELGPNKDGDLVFALDFCWGHFYEAEEGPLNCLRMVLLAVEKAFEAADAIGHPQVVLILFGGPAPCLFSQVCYKFLDRNYPERLKKAVIYPVPGIWSSVAYACMYFLKASTRDKIGLATEEAEVVESASLTGPEQLPEDWRGGMDEVELKHQPDRSLLQSIVKDFLNPFGESGEAIEKSMEGPWMP
eukprot:TRINITY_DN11561_c2_g1_i1.p1 TRINITY_DN11561_c2_g1~~TRINITY_DN11561_c2_g1_i1.p1  ORF type:complete len:337 (+),score=79.11 TRINITY_DN11561_c2_g1_i1:107-1012(+)